jgi:uncharacterized membrane protein YkoI
MLKKLLIGGGIVGLLTTGIIIGSLTLAPALAQSGNNATDQGQATISAADAEAIALAANPSTSITENKLENEKGVLVYSIELNNNIDVEVDAKTGEILRTGADDEDNHNKSEDQDSNENESDTVDEEQDKGDETEALQADAAITSGEAEATALAVNSGATIVKTELENENGVLVYSIKLNNGSEVKVDAGTGKILRTESDDMNDEGESGRADED